MATKAKRKYVTVAVLSEKQAADLQKKLRAAIAATTKQLERKNLDNPWKSDLKKYRKMLMDANNFFGWSIAPKCSSKSTAKRTLFD